MPERVPMTAAGYQKLQAELRELEAKRPQLQRTVREAREHGDLAENAEYHAARDALGALDERIGLLRAQLENADLLDAGRLPDDVSTIGSTITLLDLDTGDECEYTLVGAGEQDFTSGRILTTSPLGQALLRRRVGDEFEVQVPRGVLRYRVLRLERRGI